MNYCKEQLDLIKTYLDNEYGSPESDEAYKTLRSKYNMEGDDIYAMLFDLGYVKGPDLFWD